MRIDTVTHATFEQVLPLIADYQRFYEAVPNESNNRAHFSHFLDDHERGIQFVAQGDEGKVLGFATLYFQMRSTTPGVCCVMNDLFTVPLARGKGVGRALILHCLAYAQSRGYKQMSWQTDQSNVQAQRLYDSLPTTRKAKIIYSLGNSA